MHRFTLVVAMVATTLAVVTGPAVAHVTLNPNEAPAGGFANFEVRVPTERPDASTTKVELFFPEDNPLPFVNVMPDDTWDYEIERRELDEPLEVFGEEFTEVISKITWEGGEIGPGEFDEFEISVGPIPEGVSQLVFRAIQTYDSGEVVRWAELAEPGGEEPELPAPVVTVVAGEVAPATEGATEAATAPGTDDADDKEDGDNNGLAIAALVTALLALTLAAVALVRARPARAT